MCCLCRRRSRACGRWRPRPRRRGQPRAEDLRQFLHVPGVTVAAVCDIYPPRSAQVNRLCGAEIPMTASYQELLARTDLDAVLIASPVSLHAEHVIAAARSGRPILSEKALGLRWRTTRGLSTRCWARGVCGGAEGDSEVSGELGWVVPPPGFGSKIFY